MLDNPTWSTRIPLELLRDGGHYFMVVARGAELKYADPRAGSIRIDVLKIDGELVEETRTVSIIGRDGRSIASLPPGRAGNSTTTPTHRFQSGAACRRGSGASKRSGGCDAECNSEQEDALEESAPAATTAATPSADRLCWARRHRRQCISLVGIASVYAGVGWVGAR
jgi:hypothetical protein